MQYTEEEQLDLEVRRLRARLAHLEGPGIQQPDVLGYLYKVLLGQQHVREQASLLQAQDLSHQAALTFDHVRLDREARTAALNCHEFMVHANHEIRTPVHTLQLQVYNLLYLLREGTRPTGLPGQADMLRTCERQVWRLCNLLGNISEGASTADGAGDQGDGRIDLTALARDIIERCATELSRAGCQAVVYADGPVWGPWERDRVERVLINLLSNAIKFGAGRPIEISVARQGPGGARISVQDHGIGIAPQDQGRIFGRFERACSASRYGGLGLGLYIAGKIVAELGGSIMVSSQPGAGSTFAVDLPQA